MNFKQAHPSNFRLGRSSSIKYLVIHFTGNKGDTAKNNALYFSGNVPNTSAHYFVDEKEIWQSVKDTDTAWHCGADTTYRHGQCRNHNSIGIEMCNFRTINDKVANRTIELVRVLMAKYNIPIQNILRHYDVTGKKCPAPFVDNENAWIEFKRRLTESEETEMIYNWIDKNMPEWARPTIQKLVDKGYLKGNDKGELGLNDTMLKLLVVNDRAGLYDK